MEKLWRKAGPLPIEKWSYPVETCELMSGGERKP